MFQDEKQPHENRNHNNIQVAWIDLLTIYSCQLRKNPAIYIYASEYLFNKETFFYFLYNK